MKIKLLAGLIAIGFAAPVLAQSSVTIYGIADAGIQISHNGGSDRTVKLVSGIADGSRLGFKGSEDLGGGYRAVFTLESRIEFDTGKQSVGNLSTNQGVGLTRGMGALGPLLPTIAAALQPATNVNSNNALFDRTSMVGLVTPYGAILAGRQYTPAYEAYYITDTFEAGTAGTWGNITGGLGGLLTTGSAIRSDKSIQYRFEKDGFGGALMYGFKNSGYVGLDDRFIGGKLTYKANGWDLAMGYNRGTDQSNQTGLITRVIGGSYSTGDFKFFAGYQDNKNNHSVLIPVFIGTWDTSIAPGLVASRGAVVAGALRNVFVTNLVNNFNLNVQSVSLGMHYKVGSGRIMTSISHQNDRAATDSDVTQYAIGYDHFLSKRTDIYTVLGIIRNRNLAQYAPGVASASGGFTGSPGESGRALQFGMRHKF
jgi:predicted porin